MFAKSWNKPPAWPKRPRCWELIELRSTESARKSDWNESQIDDSSEIESAR